MKKAFLGLLTVSALALAGCATKMSKEEAKAFVKENYTSSAEKRAKVKSVTEVNKAEGIFKDLFKSGSEEYETLSTPVDVGFVESADSTACTFKKDGKKLIYIIDLEGQKVLDHLGIESSKFPKGFNLEAKFNSEAKTNEEGYFVETVGEFSIDLSYEQAGIKVTGAVEVKNTSTYTF